MVLSFILLTLVVLKTKAKTDQITVLCCIIYILQQIRLFISISPFSNAHNQISFRHESLFLLLSFNALLGLFLPVKWYLPPVAIIYSGFFWVAYGRAKERDLCWLDVLRKFSLYLGTGVVSACVV